MQPSLQATPLPDQELRREGNHNHPRSAVHDPNQSCTCRPNRWPCNCLRAPLAARILRQLQHDHRHTALPPTSQTARQPSQSRVRAHSRRTHRPRATAAMSAPFHTNGGARLTSSERPPTNNRGPLMLPPRRGGYGRIEAARQQRRHRPLPEEAGRASPLPPHKLCLFILGHRAIWWSRRRGIASRHALGTPVGPTL